MTTVSIIVNGLHIVNLQRRHRNVNGKLFFHSKLQLHQGDLRRLFQSVNIILLHNSKLEHQLFLSPKKEEEGGENGMNRWQYITLGVIIGCSLTLLSVFVPAFGIAIIGGAYWIKDQLVYIIFEHYIGVIFGALVISGIWAGKRYDILRTRRNAGKEQKEILKPLGLFAPTGTVMRPNPQPAEGLALTGVKKE